MPALLLSLAARDAEVHAPEHAQRVIRAALKLQTTPEEQEALHEAYAVAAASLLRAAASSTSGASLPHCLVKTFLYSEVGADSAAGSFRLHCSEEFSSAGTGGYSWGGGVAAASLALSRPHLFAGARVMELGCGCGLTGIALARARRASLCLTDGNAAAVSLTRLNLELNGCLDDDSCFVQELAWESLTEKVAAGFGAEVIISADTIYDPDAIPALISALSALLRPPSARVAYVFVIPRQPSSLHLFLSQAAAAGLTPQDRTEEMRGDDASSATPRIVFPGLPAAVEDERDRALLIELHPPSSTRPNE